MPKPVIMAGGKPIGSVDRDPWDRKKSGFSPAKRMRDIREAKGLSREELAFELRVSSTTIQNYEEGRLPKSDYLIKFSDYFECSIDWILTGELRRPIFDFIETAIKYAGELQIRLRRTFEPDILAETVINIYSNVLVNMGHDEILSIAEADYCDDRLKQLFIELLHNTNVYPSNTKLEDEVRRIAGKGMSFLTVDDFIEVERHFEMILEKNRK